MCDVTYHLRRARGVNVVVRQQAGIEKPLPRSCVMPELTDDWEWGVDSFGAIRLATDLLADAIPYRHLAAIAAPAFAQGVLAMLTGDCVLSRDALRDWFYRSVRFAPSPKDDPDAEATDATVIV